MKRHQCMRTLQQLHRQYLMIRAYIVWLVLCMVVSIWTVSINADQQLLQKHDVTILYDSDFQKATGINIKNPKPLPEKGEWLILFYAGWCGHCKRFIRQTYQSIVENIDRLQFKVTAAAIDCPSNPAICGQMMIAQFPSIYYFKQDGSKIKYPKGDRGIQNMVDFVKNTHQGKEFSPKKMSEEADLGASPAMLEKKQNLAANQKNLDTQIRLKQNKRSQFQPVPQTTLQSSKNSELKAFNALSSSQPVLPKEQLPEKNNDLQAGKKDSNVRRKVGHHDKISPRALLPVNLLIKIGMCFFAGIVLLYIYLKYQEYSIKSARRMVQVDAAEEKIYSDHEEEDQKTPQECSIPEAQTLTKNVSFEQYIPESNEQNKQDSSRSSFEDLNDQIFEDIDGKDTVK